MKEAAVQLANSGLVFVLSAIAIRWTIFPAVVFIIRGRKEADHLGIPKDIQNKAMSNSVLVSIVPSLPIIIIMTVMMPLLGRYISWLRLSVNGPAMYENMAADITARSFGLTSLADPNFTPEIFVGILWVMTLGVIQYPLVNALFLKSLDKGFTKLKAKGGFIEKATPAIFIGVMCVYLIPYIANKLDCHKE